MSNDFCNVKHFFFNILASICNQKLKESSRYSRNYYRLQETTKKCQTVPENSRKYQKIPDFTRNNQKVSESIRKYKKVPESARKYQELPVSTRTYHKLPKVPDITRNY